MRNKEIHTANDRRELAKIIMKRMENEPDYLKTLHRQLGHTNITATNYENIIAAHIRNEDTENSNSMK